MKLEGPRCKVVLWDRPMSALYSEGQFLQRGMSKCRVRSMPESKSLQEPCSACGCLRKKSKGSHLLSWKHGSSWGQLMGCSVPMGKPSKVLWAGLAAQVKSAGASTIPWIIAQQRWRMNCWCCLPVLTLALAYFVCTVPVYICSAVLQAQLGGGCPLIAHGGSKQEVCDKVHLQDATCHFSAAPNKYCCPAYISVVNTSCRLQIIARNIDSQSPPLLKAISLLHTLPFTAPHTAAVQSLANVCHKALTSKQSWMKTQTTFWRVSD